MLRILLVFMVLSACSPPLYLKPYEAPVGAPPDYTLGWEHGCKSGFAAFGADFHKTLYEFTQDVSMINNPTYFKAWTDSFNYCRAYINRYLAGGYSFATTENPTIFSRRNLSLQGYDIRTKSPDNGTLFGVFEGVDPVGWGSNAWGKNVECEADWLNRKPAGCGWMGYGN